MPIPLVQHAMRACLALSLGCVLATVGCSGAVDPTPVATPPATPTVTATPQATFELRLSLASGPFTAGKAYPWSVQVISSRDGEVTDEASVRLRVAPSAAVTVTSDKIVLEKAGAYTLTAEASISGQTLSEVAPRDVVAAAPVAVAVSLSDASARAGSTVALSAALVDAYGNIAFEDPQIEWAVEPQEGVTLGADSLIATAAGAYLLSATNPATGLAGQAELEIVPGASVGLSLSLSDDRVAPGDTVAVVAVTTDAYGNLTESDATLSTEPSEGVRIAGSRLIFSLEGVYTVLATWAAEDRDLSATQGPITVDGTPPNLTITSPQRAAWASTTTLNVRGTASDGLAGLDAVYLGDSLLPIASDGSFSAPLRLNPGLNVLKATAIDRNGNRREQVQAVIYAADHAQPGERVHDAFYGRMGTETIDELAGLLEAELDLEEINSWATSYNPIEAYYDVYTGPLGTQIVTSAYINIIELRYSDAVVTLVPQADEGSGHLSLDLVFDDLGLTLEAYGELANVDYSLCGTLDTSEGVATGTIRATFDDAGVSHVQMSGVQVHLNGFDMEMCDDSLDLLLEAIEESLQEELEQVLVDLIYEDIPEELETLINSMTVSETFEFEGAEMVLDAALQGMTFDDAGATLWMWSQLSTEVMPGLPINPGAPLTPSIPPTYPDTHSLYVSANDDLLNQLLYTMWSAGTLHLRYSAEDLGLTPEQIALLFNGATEVLFALEPALPPVMTPSYEIGYLLDAGLGDCYIKVYSDATTQEPEDLALDYTLVTTLIAPADADAPTPSILRISFGTPSTLHVQVLQTLTELPLSEEALNLVLNAAADELITFLNSSMSEVPIPTVDGYALYAYDFYMDGPQGDYLTIAGDLVPPP